VQADIPFVTMNVDLAVMLVKWRS